MENEVKSPTLLVPSYNKYDEELQLFFGETLVPIDCDRPITEQIQGTDLDFEIRTIPTYYLKDGLFQKIENKKALIHLTTNRVFDIVGKNWQVHQPGEVLSTFQGWCKEAELNMTHVGQLNGGSIVYALADYPDTIEFGDDVTSTKILLSNFNRLGFCTKIDLFTYRLVCSNGMTVRHKETGVSLSHKSNDDINVRLEQALSKLSRSFSNYKITCKQLTQVNMSKAEAQALLIKNFGDANKTIEEQPRAVQTIMQLFEGEGKGSDYLSAFNTAYGLLQASTEYLNHHSRRTQTHLASVLYGGKNNSAQKMMQSLSNTYL